MVPVPLTTWAVYTLTLSWTLSLVIVLPLLATTHVDAIPFGIPPANKTANCQYGISLEWTARVGSSVFATPVIADLMHDGKKEVLIPTFSQYLEAVNGANGEDVPGYPFIHPKLKSYASPLPVDIDADGKVEWLVAMYTGELILFNDKGKARGLLRVPPLAVKKRWMDARGTDLDKLAAMRVKTDAAHDPRAMADYLRARKMNELHLFPARYNEQGGAPGGGAKDRALAMDEEGNYLYSPPQQERATVAQRRMARTAAVDAMDKEDREIAVLKAGMTAERNAVHDAEWNDRDRPRDAIFGDTEDDGHRTAQDERDEHDWQEEYVPDGDVEDDDDFYYDGNDQYLPRMPEEEHVEPKQIGPDGRLSNEAKASMKILFNPELYRAKIEYDDERDAFSRHNLRGKSTVTVMEDEVAVDAHILSTPRIVDIDGNGDLDVIVHASYFFDEREYASPIFKKTPLPEDVNASSYVATAVVCINLVTGELKWMHPLHLSTKMDPNPAYGLSSPLVVNAETQNASLEIYVTSSTGSVVGLSSSGAVLPGWPVWMGPIAASPTAERLGDTDELSICAGDVEGKVKCFTPSGKVRWAASVIGGVADQMTFGDVNGDGHVDVVFGTSAGLIYALDGRTGATLPHFPIVTRGSIVAPVLLLNLKRRLFGFIDAGRRARSGAGMTADAQMSHEEFPPLSLVVPSHDGNVYIVHGRDGCVETIDIDEKSSSMVLADDLTGNGHMDLLVTTLSGGVYAFETVTDYHPLKVWNSKTKGLNGNSAGESRVGVYILPEYRKPRDVRGDKFRLKIAIEDFRSGKENRRYAVSVYVGTRTRVFQGVFKEAKEYSVQLRTPLERMYSSVTVVMTLPNGQVFTDTISLSFNMHFLTTIKYLLVIPFLCLGAALMLVHKRHEVDMDN